MFNTSEKLQRSTNDIFVVISDEEEKFRQKYFQNYTDYIEDKRCTICSLLTCNEAFPHPALKVVICFGCFMKYDSTVFLVSKDGNDVNCRWCAKPSKKYCCFLCTCVFCKSCLERNFGPSFTLDIDKEWRCLICDPKILWRLRAVCIKVIEEVGIENSSSVINDSTSLERETHASVPSASCVDNPNNNMSNKRLNNNNNETLNNFVTDETPSENNTSNGNESEMLHRRKRPVKPLEDEDKDEGTKEDESHGTDFLNNSVTDSQSSSENESVDLACIANAQDKLREILKHIWFFIKLLVLRMSAFDTKIFQRDKLDSYEDVAKTFAKMSKFCDLAVRNLNGINNTIKNDFERWFQIYNSCGDNILTFAENDSANAKPCASDKDSTIRNTNSVTNDFSPSSDCSTMNKNEDFDRKIQSRNNNCNRILEETLADVKSNNLTLSADRKSTKKFKLSLSPNKENKNNATCSNEDHANDTPTVSNGSVNNAVIIEDIVESTNRAVNNIEMCENSETDINSEFRHIAVSDETVVSDERAISELNELNDTTVKENSVETDMQKTNGSIEYVIQFVKSEASNDINETATCNMNAIQKNHENADTTPFNIIDQIQKDVKNECVNSVEINSNETNIHKTPIGLESSTNFVKPLKDECDVAMGDYNSEEITSDQKLPMESIDVEQKIIIKQEIDDRSIFSDDTEILDLNFYNDQISSFDIPCNLYSTEDLSEQNQTAAHDRNREFECQCSEHDNEQTTDIYTEGTEHTNKYNFMKNIGLQSISASADKSNDSASEDSRNERAEEAYLQLCDESSDCSFSESEDFSSEFSDEDITDESVRCSESDNSNKSRKDQISNKRVPLINTARSEVYFSDDTDTEDDALSNKVVKDMKLLQCFVKISRINMENCKAALEDREEREINRLTNLASLKRPKRLSLSSDSSLRRRKKISKRKKPNEKVISDSSDFNSTDSPWKSSLSSDDSNQDNSVIFDINSCDNDEKERKPDESDNFSLITDKSLDNENFSDDECVLFEEQHNDKEKNTKETDIDAENTIELSDTDIKSDNADISNEKTNDDNKDKKSKWRQHSLLKGSLNLISSDDTNDSTANALVKKQKERDLEKAEANFFKRREEEIHNVTVIDSDTSDLSDYDSDCQFVCMQNKKRPYSNDSDEDDDERDRIKKGRRNIKEVMSDELLEEETKKADKEEAERKERIEMKHKSLENALSQTQLSEEDVGLVLDVDEVTMKPVVSVHPRLVPILKPHQCNGIKFMWDVCFESVKQYRKDKGAGCILAHCMGLGKTLQIVVLSHTLLTNKTMNVKRILIVVPLSTLFNWKKEFITKLQPNGQPIGEPIKICEITADKHKDFYKKASEIRLWKTYGGVLLISYESFQKIAFCEKRSNVTEETKKMLYETLVDPGPDMIVCDEGHMLKNGKTSRFKCLSQVKTMRRIILTGTPLQNNLTEYYFMVSFVKPHLLGTYREYMNRFLNPIQNGQYEDSGPEDISLMRKRSHVLHKKLETTVQRYEVSELKQYLPDKLDYVVFVQLSAAQIKLYQRYLEFINQAVDRKATQLFTNFHNLQNIWTHPALLQMKIEKSKNKEKKVKTYEEVFVPELDPDNVKDNILSSDWFQGYFPDDVMTNIEHGPKMKILLSIVKECEAVDDKLLVFSSVRAELDIVEYFLKNIGTSQSSWVKDWDYFRMDGTVPPEIRTKYCNIFNDENNKRARVFLLSHKVGGLGLNLMAANRVVLMDVSWNPAYDAQSVFRVYRFGQGKKCYIYRFISMGTMEEIVYGRSITKLATAGRVVDEQQITRHFKSADLQRMYRLNCNFDKERPTPTLPTDRMLAKLLELHNPTIYKYHEHQSLLENVAAEELNDEEMKLAWEEFRNEEEQDKRRQLQVPVFMPSAKPNNSLQQNVQRNPYAPFYYNPNLINMSVTHPTAVPTSSNAITKNLNTPSFGGFLSNVAQRMTQISLSANVNQNINPVGYSAVPNGAYYSLAVPKNDSTSKVNKIQHRNNYLLDVPDARANQVQGNRAATMPRNRMGNNFNMSYEKRQNFVSTATNIAQNRNLRNALKYNFARSARTFIPPAAAVNENMLPHSVDNFTTENQIDVNTTSGISQEGHSSLVANKSNVEDLTSLLSRNPSLKVFRGASSKD